MCKARIFPSSGFIISQSFYTPAKLHFRPYIPNQIIIFLQRIDENIAENAYIRIANALVDSSKKLCMKTRGDAYHPKIMLKVNLYAYMK